MSGRCFTVEVFFNIVISRLKKQYITPNTWKVQICPDFLYIGTFSFFYSDFKKLLFDFWSKRPEISMASAYITYMYIKHAASIFFWWGSHFYGWTSSLGRRIAWWRRYRSPILSKIRHGGLNPLGHGKACFLLLICLIPMYVYWIHRIMNLWMGYIFVIQRCIKKGYINEREKKPWFILH